MLAARKTNVITAHARKIKRSARTLANASQEPFDTPPNDHGALTRLYGQTFNKNPTKYIFSEILRIVGCYKQETKLRR